MTDKMIDALYRDTPLTLHRPTAGVPMAEFWESTEAGHGLLFLVVNVASKLRPQLVTAAVDCAKFALETARAKRGDVLDEGTAIAVEAVEVADGWLHGTASLGQVKRLAMDAIAIAGVGLPHRTQRRVRRPKREERPAGPLRHRVH